MSTHDESMPLDAFLANPASVLSRLRESGAGLVVTDGGTPCVVIDSIDPAEIRGLEAARQDVAEGRTVPADQVVAELREKYGLAR